MAHTHLWWPHLDKDLENHVRACVLCQTVGDNPALAPLHPTVWPARPWLTVHFDFADPFEGKNFLIAIDTHSKWAEVCKMPRTVFAAYGLPQQIVTDNGPQFTAEKFCNFLRSNGVKHIQCSSYHPSSNGLAMRFMKTFKGPMKPGSLPLPHWIANFILTYQSTPHATTSRTPVNCSLGGSYILDYIFFTLNVNRN